MLSRAAEIAQTTLGAESQASATYIHNIAIIHYRKGEYGLSEELFSKSLRIAEALETPNPVLPLTLNYLGRVNEKLGDAGTAIRFYDRALAISAHWISQDPEDLLSRASQAASLVGRGDVHRGQGRQEKARNDYSAALSILESVELTESPSLLTRAQALIHLGRLDAAEPIMTELHARGWHHPEFLELSSQHGWGPAAGTSAGTGRWIGGPKDRDREIVQRSKPSDGSSSIGWKGGEDA